MADTRDRPLGHDPDRVTPEFELRSNGHKADVSAVEPFAEEIEIHRKEILDGEGAEPRRVAVSPSRALLNELRVNEGR